MFLVNADPDVKWCEMQNIKKMKRNLKKVLKYPATHFLFFVFCEHIVLFRNKCIVDFRSSSKILFFDSILS